ncbi:hypothetical protein PVC01_000042400, partial [Plasmodium vivax]
YPFLNEVWTTYKKFDNTIEDDNNEYNAICDFYVLKDLNEDKNKYRQFCKKLMRNLGYSSRDSKIYEFTSARCNILYYWIYNSINEEDNTYNILNQSFDVYNTYMDGIQNKKKCYNFLKYDVYEPIKVTLLDIFYDNMHIIERILKTEKEEIKTPCRKFVCECLKIYKQMDGTYCHKRCEQGQKQNYTCLKLDIFSKAYKFFHDKLLGIDPKIPSLDNIDKECPENKPTDKLSRLSTLNQHGGPEHAVREDSDVSLRVNLATPLESTDSSMKKDITTTIGTVAGASSLLALLYR